MNIDTIYKEKLSELLFLEVNKSIITDFFKINVEENIYLPVRSEDIIERAKLNKEPKDIPVSFFIQGMFFVLGCDNGFTYADKYKNILTENIEFAAKVIKGIIYDCVKEEKLLEGYIMLKGLTRVEKSKENYNHLLMLGEQLRLKDKDFAEEQLDIIKESKELDYAEPFLYEANVLNYKEKYREALECLDTYLTKGGEPSEEVLSFKNNIKTVLDYETGKELIYEEPTKALKLLLPLLDRFEDNVMLYYYIAVAYRTLGNFEKGIYYLNEALALDSTLVQVVNELGLNYASLGDYDKAIACFRKAFEATRSVEICTNLIMCYINIGDKEQAKLHLNLAKKLDSKDEIVDKLQSMLEE
jgi:tetratricopeptide (TPR) repeat protein